MKEWIPFFESLIWPVIIVVLIMLLKNQFLEILNAIKDRILSGAEISAGPSGLRLGKLEARIEEESKRIDQITNSTESTLLSLASLVIADPLKIPAYKNYLEERIKLDKTIIVGCQEYTEQRILCAIVTKLLEREAQFNRNARFEKVIPKYDFGGAGLNFIALSRGDIDIYPAYTWQGFEMTFATSLPHSASTLINFKPDDVILRLNEIFKNLHSPL